MTKNKIISIITGALAVVLTIVLLAIVFKKEPVENYTDAKDGVVFIASDFGTGSGFAIGIPGEPIQYIVTNYHVISYEGLLSSNVDVYFSWAANKYMTAQIYSYNIEKDIAVLKLPEPTTERTALKLCKMKDTDTSETFYALGYPARANEGEDYTKYDVSDIVTTSGMISKQSTVVTRDVYMLDAKISSGNSGGPLVNSKGEVVGINTFSIISASGDADYAICIDELTRIIDEEYVKYTLSTDGKTKKIALVCIAVVVDILAIIAKIILIKVDRKKKTNKVVKKTTDSKKVEKKEDDYDETYAATVATVDEVIVIKGLEGSKKGKEYSLEQTLVFGRDKSKCDIAFSADAEGVSRVHCKVLKKDNKVVIMDMGSTYGTFVNNGLRIDKNTEFELSVGDTFSIGSDKETFIVSIG